MRVYLPATLPGLIAAGAAGASGAAGAAAEVSPEQVEVAPAGAMACAVTPALREWYREGDLEELEYAALRRAALASLRLLSTHPDADRRVVLAADIADHEVVLAPEADPAAVLLLHPVRLDLVAAVHVDDPSAAADVRAAADVVRAADDGDDDAQFFVDGLDDHELQWYAVQELPYLLS